MAKAKLVTSIPVRQRTSEAWRESDPAAVKAADEWFGKLHSILNDLLIVLNVKEGLKPEVRNVLLTINQDDDSLPYGTRLNEFSLKDNRLTRLELEKSPRLSRGSGNELLRIGLYWKPKNAKSDDELACRNVRISCSSDLPDRQLTVDIPGYPIFEQRRWSAYHGFVKYHPDQLLYNVASPPTTLTADLISVAAYSCVDTIQATIALLADLTETLKGRGQSPDHISELSFLKHM